LIVRADNGGGVKTLQPLAALAFDPPMPALLKAGTTWKGTFSGSGTVKKETLFYVGFGQFGYDPRFDPRLFSITTSKSATS
jgi:hypothetical protein